MEIRGAVCTEIYKFGKEKNNGYYTGCNSALRKKADPQECTKYEEGEYVLVQHGEQIIRAGDPVEKLAPILRGPMQVVANSGDTYILNDLATDKEIVVHVKRLRPFYFDPRTMNPREIALRCTGLYDVEKVVSHHGDETPGEMREEVENRWIKWSALRNNKLLHRYLYRNGLRQLIPEEHKEVTFQEEVVRLEELVAQGKQMDGPGSPFGTDSWSSNKPGGPDRSGGSSRPRGSGIDWGESEEGRQTELEVELREGGPDDGDEEEARRGTS